jgi:hypothetical protein
MAKILCVGASQAALLHALSRRLINATLASWDSPHRNPEDLDGFKELAELTLTMERESPALLPNDNEPEIESLMLWLEDNIAMESPLRFDNEEKIGSTEALWAMKHLVGTQKELIQANTHLVAACEEALTQLECNCPGESCNFSCSHGIVFKALARATKPITKLWWKCMCPEDYHQPHSKDFCGACFSHISGGTPAEYHELRSDMLLAGWFKEIEALDEEHRLIFDLPASAFPQAEDVQESTPAAVEPNAPLEISGRLVVHNIESSERPTRSLQLKDFADGDEGIFNEAGEPVARLYPASPSSMMAASYDLASALWLAKEEGLFEKNPRIKAVVEDALRKASSFSSESLPKHNDPVATLLRELLDWKTREGVPDSPCWENASNLLASLTTR